jgi:hypothetical protein
MIQIKEEELTSLSYLSFLGCNDNLKRTMAAYIKTINEERLVFGIDSCISKLFSYSSS